jgi:hypothetical protein
VKRITREGSRARGDCVNIRINNGGGTRLGQKQKQKNAIKKLLGSLLLE